jgi:hypothetical protein
MPGEPLGAGAGSRKRTTPVILAGVLMYEDQQIREDRRDYGC